MGPVDRLLVSNVVVMAVYAQRAVVS